MEKVVFVAVLASLLTMMLCTLVYMYVYILIHCYSSEVEVEVEVGLPVDRKRSPVIQLLYPVVKQQVDSEADSVASSTKMDMNLAAAQLLSTRPPMQLIPAIDLAAAKKWEMNYGASTSASARVIFDLCWTDNRLEKLVESYHMYLTGNICDPVRDSSTHKRCMIILKNSTKVKHNDGIGHEMEVNDYIISNKLDEFAAIFKSTFEGKFCPEYNELKQILGKEMFKKLKKLVQRERFDDYLPLDQPSRCVAPPTADVLNFSSVMDKFYWTDNRLQLLVTSLHSYMNKIESERRQQGTLSGDRRACLTFIKKFMDKTNFKKLSKKLDSIFEDEKNGGQRRSHLRMRLGDKCTIFDQLLKTKYDVYKEAGTSSSRIIPSSRSISSVGKRSVSMLEQADQELKNREAKQLTEELSKLNLSNTDLVDAVILLCDDSNKRSYFRAMPTDDVKKLLVQRWLIKGG